MRKLLAILLLTALTSRSAVLFDASDDILGFGTLSDNAFKETGVLSISLWFNATSLGESSAGSLIRRGSVSARVATTQAIQFAVTGGTTLIRKTSDSVFSLGVWTHLAITWDGTTTAANVHIYINGTEVSYATTTDGVTPADNSADSLVIGNNTATTTTFAGQLSDMFISSFALKVSDIAILQSRTFGIPLMCSTALGTGWAYWPLWDFTDGATVTGSSTVRDFGPNGYHGTPTNSPAARASVVITGP